MNLDQVTLEIRPRSAWEAVDLGLLMARRWWLPMIKAWLIVSLPILFIALIIPADKWWVSVLLIWWLKPIYERPLLHILSRAVFNDLPDTRSTLKAFSSFAFKQWFLSLSFRRLSPTRSVDLAVVQLEDLNGARRQDRLAVLHREDSFAAMWATVVGFIIELSLWSGMITAVWAFIPRELDIEWAGLFFSNESAQFVELKILFWYCALALSAPFYVACGFALYLNRRIKLEAWDIDIAFRRIANKRRTPSSLGVLALCVALGLAIAGTADKTYADELPESGQPTTEHSTSASSANESIAIQSPAIQSPAIHSQASEEKITGDLSAAEHLPEMEQAETNDSTEIVEEKPLGEYTELNRNSAQDAIKGVMQQSEFSRKEKVRSLKWDEQEEEEDDEPSEFWKKFFESLENFDGFLATASLLEILLWLAVIALIAFVFYRYRHWLAAQFVRLQPMQAVREKPVTLFGMDVTRESLPQDISHSALELLHADNNRAALALLYRASLFQLIHHGVEIQDGHTEGECVQLMRDHFSQLADAKKISPSTDPRIEYFALLTRIWQQLAYGHQNPDTQLAVQLCQQWNSCWLDQTATLNTPGSQTTNKGDAL